MNYFQVIIAILAVGLCTRFFGWAGFFGSVFGQILFMVFVSYGIL